MRGPGGMISFTIKGGLEEANAFLSACKLCTLAESLGGVESIVFFFLIFFINKYIFLYIIYIFFSFFFKFSSY
jgi:hypothetical protein